MWRGISMFGFGGIFLMISPTFRNSIMSGLNSGFTTMEMYSPYSYIGAAAGVIIAAGITLNRGSRPL